MNTKKLIKPPSLSTNFSESGKRAKKRFENILNTKAKKTGWIAVVAIVLLISIMGAILGMGNNDYTYRSDALGFSLKIPRHWDAKRRIEQWENIVYFQHSQIHEIYDSAGLLFYIERIEGTLTQEEITDPGNRSIAMYANGYTYVFGMPTDVQYPIWSDGDAELNKKLAEEYLDLAKDLEKIKKSIKKTDITALSVSADTQKLYKLKDTDISDSAKVSEIVQLLPYPEILFHERELETENRPYSGSDGIIINIKVNNRANYRFLDYSTLHKSAALMFSLIPNLGELRFHIYDDYSDASNPDTSFAGSYYNRQNLRECPGMDEFTDESVRAATASIESFSDYLDKVSAVNGETFYDESFKGNSYLTQIYSIIGDDCEFVINSGMGLNVIITKNVAQDQKLNGILKPQNIHLDSFIGKDIKFSTLQVRNFKTNQRTSYLFIYDGENLVAHTDLNSEVRDRELIHLLVPYSYNGGTL